MIFPASLATKCIKRAFHVVAFFVLSTCFEVSFGNVHLNSVIWKALNNTIISLLRTLTVFRCCFLLCSVNVTLFIRFHRFKYKKYLRKTSNRKKFTTNARWVIIGGVFLWFLSSIFCYFSFKLNSSFCELFISFFPSLDFFCFLFMSLAGINLRL
jgi:hypothetical protein